MIDHNTSRRILRVQKRTPTELDRDVGARVRMRRMMLGLSQAALAEQCSISAQQIHKYESGLSRLTTSRLVQISQALAAPVGWFFGEAIDERALPDDLFDMLSDHDNLELLMALHRITNPAVKRQIIGVIDALETGDSGSEALA